MGEHVEGLEATTRSIKETLRDIQSGLSWRVTVLRQAVAVVIALIGLIGTIYVAAPAAKPAVERAVSGVVQSAVKEAVARSVPAAVEEAMTDGE